MRADARERQPDGAGIAGRHRAVARIVLTAVREVRGEPAADALWGLFGSNALIAHRVSVRPAANVDVAVGRLLGDWCAIEDAIEEALARNGYSARWADLLNFGADGYGDPEEAGRSEWAVRAPGDDQDVQVKVSHYGLLGGPATMPGLGPVAALRDIAGWKTVAFTGRRTPLDAFDIAELRTRFTVGELLQLARERCPRLSPADIARAGQFLDRAGDATLGEALTGTGRTPAWVRAQLAGWPRH
jgi:hypothetical protein